MNGKYKKTCKYLNCVENLLILALAITGCLSISAFTSLVCVPVCITSSAVRIKTVQLLQESKNIGEL